MSAALVTSALPVLLVAEPAAAAATVLGYSWGLGTSGQLGNGGTSTFSYPVAISTQSAISGKTLTSVSAGGTFACGLANDGTAASTRAYCWGLGTSGQLGNATSVTSNIPVAVAGALASLQVSHISAGNDHACAVTVAGAVYCWGANASGQLGQGAVLPATSNIPLLVSGGTLAGTTATAVTAGTSFSCAITPASATKTHCWGINATGQMGDGTGVTPRTSPVAVTGTVTATTPSAISAGVGHACAVSTVGSVQCWGLGTSGQLGNNASLTSTVSVTAIGLPTTTSTITAGNAFTCASTSAGAGYCWGLGTSGQLGNTLATTTNSAVAVYSGGALAGKSISTLRAGATSACAVTSDGGGFCWGSGTSGALGNQQTAGQSNEPAAVFTGTTATGTGPGTYSDISPGTSFAVAIFNRSSVPGAPTITSTTPGNGSMRVDFAAPADTGGSAIAAYTVTSSNGQTCSPALPILSCTVTGLTTGVSYSFTVTATNSVGTGPASSPSAPIAPLTTPLAPTAVTAQVGTSGPAAGVSTATIAWVAPSNAAAAGVTSYTVVSTPAGGTGCGTVAAATLTCTMGNLTNGISYTFTVTANNAAGAGATSIPSSPITVATTPNPPTSVTVLPGDKSILVSWTATTVTGGSPITSYTATAVPGGATCTTSGTTCTITGLANRTTYTSVSVVARNSVGSSVPSIPSGPVTPTANSTTRVTIKGKLIPQPQNKKKNVAVLQGLTPFPGMQVSVYRINLSDGSTDKVATVTSNFVGRWAAKKKVGTSTTARFYAISGGVRSRTLVLTLRSSRHL